MDPLKQLIAVVTSIALFLLLYSVFSSFFSDVTVNQQFPALEPNHVLLYTTPIEKAYRTSLHPTGTAYVMSYQKGNVIYLENISLHTNSEVKAYFSKSQADVEGPFIGSLLGTKGNVTLYVPPDLVVTKYPFVVFVVDVTKELFAYANMSALLN